MSQPSVEQREYSYVQININTKTQKHKDKPRIQRDATLRCAELQEDAFDPAVYDLDWVEALKMAALFAEYDVNNDGRINVEAGLMFGSRWTGL